MSKHFRKLLVTGSVVGALAAMTGTASAAGIYPEFTINQAGVSACTPGVDVNDQSCTRTTPDFMNGSYQEIFTVNLADPTKFSTVAYWDMTSFVANDGGSPLTTWLKAFEPGGYSVYALFGATGTISSSGGVNTFTSNSGCVDLYIDVNQNDVKTLPAVAPLAPSCAAPVPAPPPGLGITVTNTADDVLLATANISSSLGQQQSGQTGHFDIFFQPFTLTPGAPGSATGQGFFIAPTPFYLIARLQGDFNAINIAAGASTTVGGSANNTFQAVPEPATLTLFGLGLVGSALVARRRSRKN